ncbi:MAG: antirestriction protein ArdA [Oscillospiraceae bacterium]|nr:antirestriction protein ArdA [Oscillospiraceae bacterium]
MIINVFLVNKNKYFNENELVGEWLKLPCTITQIESMKENILLDKYDDYMIEDYKTDIPNMIIPVYDTIEYLNVLAQKLETLSIDELKQFDEVLKNETSDYYEAYKKIFELKKD